MLHPGLYEQVINNQLDTELSAVAEARKFTSPIDKVEASKVLSQYLSEVIESGLDNVRDKATNFFILPSPHRSMRSSRFPLPGLGYYSFF